MSEQSFPRRVRLRTASEFSRVIGSGRVVADDCLVLHLARSSTPTLRLGVSIPKRTGHAPCRNRWKRLIREAFRRQQTVLPVGWDLVVRPRRGARCDYARIARSLANLARRGTRLEQEPTP